MLSSAEIVADTAGAEGIVTAGAIVEIRYEGDDDTEKYLVGSIEERREGVSVISPNSPLGQALIGKTPGDTVEWDAPSGKLTAEVVTVGT
jgi:transcription elongation factor GreA